MPGILKKLIGFSDFPIDIQFQLVERYPQNVNFEHIFLSDEEWKELLEE